MSSKNQLGLNRITLLALLIGAAVIGLAVQLALQKPDHYPMDVVTLDHGSYLYNQGIRFPDFALVDQQNRPIDQAALAGTWYFWFFGFTHCPDICPTTMATLSASEQLIHKDSPNAKLNTIFVTVDPERDTPQRLKEYLASFDPQVIGITGSEEDLAALRKKLGIIAVKRKDENSASGITFDHSSSIYLTAPDGRIAAVFPAPHDAKEISRDFLTIYRNLNS